MSAPGVSAGRLRSLLFAPASRPEVVAKLPRSEPDGVVLDLEDAVAPSGKQDARRVARELGGRLATEHPGIAVYVRVNAVPTEWFTDDVRRALHPDLAGVVVPKVESPAQVEAVLEALAGAGVGDLGILAGIETAAGVAAVEQLLRPPVTAAYFGAEDFIADLGGVRTPGNREVLYARSRVVLAARLGGVHALDQIVATYDDEAVFVADAGEGKALGYGGKLCIHPRQVAWANGVFSPSPDELERARRLLDAYEAAASAGDSVITFDGQMVDEPMARRARALLDEGV